VEPADVRRLVRRLEEETGLAPASVVKVLTPLKAMFATAVEDGDLASNPATAVRVNGRREEGGEEPEPKAMTRDELGRVLAHMPAEWLLFSSCSRRWGCASRRRSGSIGRTSSLAPARRCMCAGSTTGARSGGSRPATASATCRCPPR
jgi:integrase